MYKDGDPFPNGALFHVFETANRLCTDLSTYACFFVGLLRSRLSQTLARHGTALRYDPPLRAPAGDEEELKISGLGEAPGQRASSDRKVASLHVLPE
jgi:hypothetical protein